MRRFACSWTAIVLVATLAACAGPTERDLPNDVTVTIDQSRLLRKTRTVHLRVHNGSQQAMTVTGFRLTSQRFEDVEWSGEEEIGAGYETDLDFPMPRGRCGHGVGAVLTLDYRVGGESRRSVVRPDDVYGAATALLDRDCAATTVREAATVEVGEVRVEGSGRSAVLELPVTFTPTGRRHDVVLTGVGSTVLFDLAPTAAPIGEYLLSGVPFTIDLRLVPHRCDAHALADDKVGTLIPVQVRADGLSEGEFYLPLASRQRTAFFDYYTEACGLD